MKPEIPEPSFESLESELKALRPTSPPPSVTRSLEGKIEGATPLPTTRIQQGRFGIHHWIARARAWMTVSSPVRIGLAFGIGVGLFFGSYAIFKRQLNQPQKLETPRHAGGPKPLVPAQFLTENFQPTEVGRYLLDAHDEGIVIEVGGTPMRRVRYQIMDVYTWQDQADSTTFQLNIPREERLIIPVATF